MSDLCLCEFEDIAWDELCGTDDHIVPHPGPERVDDQSFLGDSHKKPRREVTNIPSSTRDRSTAEHDEQVTEQVQYSPLSKGRNIMLEKDSWSHTPSGVFPSSSDSGSIKEASSLTSENTTSSSHAFKSNSTCLNGNELCENDTNKANAVDNNSFSFPLSDITHTGNNLDFFENTQDKDSSDFLYYGWPEIGNFEDVDRMFRSCDSTFGLGPSKEEMDWLSSADNIGGSEDVVNSAFKFPSPDTKPVENVSQNDDSPKSYSFNESGMMNEPTKHKDGSWTSEKSGSYISFVTGPAMANGKDGFIPKEQINEQKKQVKLQNQSVGKRKEHCSSNPSFLHMSNLPNEVLQLPSGATSHQTFLSEHALGPDSCNYLRSPLPYVHSNNSSLTNQTSVNPTPSAVKSEDNDLTSTSPRVHMSNLPNEVLQLPSGATSHQTFLSEHALGPDSCNYLRSPLPYVHSNNSSLSNQTSVNPTPSAVKSEDNDLTSTSPRGASHASSLPSLENAHNHSFRVTSPAGSGKREKLHNRQSSQSSEKSSLENASAMVQATIVNPGSTGKQVQYPGDKSENLSGIEEVSHFIPAELGSSNIQESSMMTSGMDDISLEAASFRQLQLVMEQLDLRTRLCIRDSLYRLARSAEQRHNHATLNDSSGDKRDAGGAFMAEGANSLMDMETDTNPIDRSIAHLLFHRPSESIPAHDSSPLKTPSTVCGSATNLPVMVENLATAEETASK
ncbi:hypothetical protein CDL12_10989 [Handroanthus impetiginosus]|uniref:Protein LNK1 n=1 Tax=Handroanthus impetiginosus TaxID=429701 RepID=A0A2G9HFR1_9LAMI|nr:hypothetical protein CDL12_10989 [Handroanthus impetiginosus]